MCYLNIIAPTSSLFLLQMVQPQYLILGCTTLLSYMQAELHLRLMFAWHWQCLCDKKSQLQEDKKKWTEMNWKRKHFFNTVENVLLKHSGATVQPFCTNHLTKNVQEPNVTFVHHALHWGPAASFISPWTRHLEWICAWFYLTSICDSTWQLHFICHQKREWSCSPKAYQC